MSMKEGDTFRICSLNVNGLRPQVGVNRKLLQLKADIRAWEADAWALQEVQTYRPAIPREEQMVELMRTDTATWVSCGFNANEECGRMF